MAALLVCLGLISAVAAWFRWAASERAIRNKAPLPSLGFSLILVVVLVAAGVVTLTVGL